MKNPKSEFKILSMTSHVICIKNCTEVKTYNLDRLDFCVFFKNLSFFKPIVQPCLLLSTALALATSVTLISHCHAPPTAAVVCLKF